MKRDGRSLDHRTLETIRLMAVERVRDGERPSSVIASYGFSRTTIYKWLEVASRPWAGATALLSRPCDGTAAQIDTTSGAAGVPVGERVGRSLKARISQYCGAVVVNRFFLKLRARACVVSATCVHVGVQGPPARTLIASRS
jgi:hypothetical protein